MRLLIQEEKWSLGGLGLLSPRRSCLEVLQESQIWMRKIYFTPINMDRLWKYHIKKFLKKKKKKRPWAWWKFLKGRDGQKLHDKGKRKEKKRKIINEITIRVEVEVFGRNNDFRHPTVWPSFSNVAQGPISKYCSVESTFIISSSLTLSKLPWDMTSVVRAATKPN